MGDWLKVIGVIILINWAYTSFTKEEKEYQPQNSSYYESTSYSPTGYSNDYSYERDEPEEPENPYDEGSGHYAGYEWAQENDPSYCDGNSDSFIEGCQEYLDQQEEYEEEGEE